ncbi:hypothetical protein DVDV_1499 [Desulfovibrio sp. DV]|uniref:hypothetical protein n=1 Tax=Desulfovibrio sp. DV TaxID=1844708 RepID=UPI000969C45F|nr:hypothetical protein [Desulfovibrio sp. DV]OLN28624.1 hypothetical protein DVDV_1499 [Desulfovibrio sp. DV]
MLFPWLRHLGAAGLVCLALAGCSDEPARDGGQGVTGKTPVVRPEDVYGPSGGRAAVLAPDYRQGMTPGLAAGTVPAAGPDKTRPGTTPGDPAAGRLVAAGPAAGAGSGPAAPLAPGLASGGGGAGGTALSPAQPPGRAGAEIPAGQPPASGTPGTAGAPGASGRASTGFPVADSRQLVLVTAADFQATRGTVQRFVRSGPGAPWTEAGQPVPCQLGRKGLGVGRGLWPGLAGGPAKHQGDGRTPAGLFALPAAFGYAGAETAAAAGVRLPYMAVTDRVSCITDPASPLFGRVVGPDERPEGGLRQDRMVRDDGANAWGVVIGHNNQSIDPEGGTCLFVNVRPAGGPPTGGSIGLASEQAAALAAWLDPGARPLLAVLPQAEYRSLAAGWGLP